MKSSIVKCLFCIFILFISWSCSNEAEPVLVIPDVLDTPYYIEVREIPDYSHQLSIIKKYRQCDYYGVSNEQIMDSVVYWSDKYDIQQELILGLITTESHFDIMAVSSCDCRGLTQLCRDTVTWFNQINDVRYEFDEIFDYDMNIEVSCWYLRRLYDYSEQLGIEKTDVLAAYNLGYRNVGQTTEYPNKVLNYATYYLVD